MFGLGGGKKEEKKEDEDDENKEEEDPALSCLGRTTWHVGPVLRM